MLDEGLSHGESPIHGVDPRVRILCAIVFAAAVAVSMSPYSIGLGVAAAMAMTFLARLPLSAIWRRLSRLNLLLAGLLAFLFLGEALMPAAGMRVVMNRGVFIVLKANAIVMCLSALIGTLSALDLGHALWRLGVPTKLTYLLLLTVRYLDVLHRELDRARMAMRARAFEPKLDRHTLRTLGYLVGMLMARAFDRSERIHDAMRCRGFRGAYPVLAEYRFGPYDAVFSATWLAIIAAISAGNVI